jgi:F0F1-type ATP synthase membrane subunit b/b'
VDQFIQLISHIPFGGLSFASLVTLAIVLIFRGDIVPKATVDAMRTDRDAIITQKNLEIDTLKQAFRLSEEARRLDGETNHELLELGRTTVHLLESIKKQANEVGVR